MESFNDNVMQYNGNDIQVRPEKANISMRVAAFMIDHAILTVILVVPFQK